MLLLVELQHVQVVAEHQGGQRAPVSLQLLDAAVLGAHLLTGLRDFTLQLRDLLRLLGVAQNWLSQPDFSFSSPPQRP